MTLDQEQYEYLNNKNYIPNADKHKSCDWELKEGEMWIGNTSGNVAWKKGVDIPSEYVKLKTIRLGEQAYCINGKPISRDYCRPLIVHKSEYYLVELIHKRNMAV